jgi:hypothetical protein
MTPRLTFLGAFLSFLARAFLGLPSLLSLAGFSLAAALGALAFLGAGLASEDAGRFFGLGAASCRGSQQQGVNLAAVHNHMHQREEPQSGVLQALICIVPAALT